MKQEKQTKVQVSLSSIPLTTITLTMWLAGVRSRDILVLEMSMLTIVWWLDDMVNRRLLVFSVSTSEHTKTISLTDFQTVRCSAYIPADGSWSVLSVSSCCVRFGVYVLQVRVFKYRFLSMDSPSRTVLSYIKRIACVQCMVCAQVGHSSIVGLTQVLIGYMCVSEGVLMCN